MEKVAQLPASVPADPAEFMADASLRSHLEQEILPGYLAQCRWYRSKTRKISRTVFEAWAPLTVLAIETEKSSPLFAVVKVFFENEKDEDAERYALPLSLSPEKILGDAVYNPLFAEALLKTSLEGIQISLGNGALKGFPFSAEDPSGKFSSEKIFSQLLGGEQSNTSFVFSSGHFLKLYRRLEEGLNPEPEILSFLKQAQYPHVPAFRAALEWHRADHPPVTVAMVQDRIQAEENAWEFMLKQLSAMETDSVSEELAAWIRQLGTQTAGLHLTLGSRHDSEAFAPEPFPAEDLTIIRSNTASLLKGALGVSEGRSPEDRDVIQNALLTLMRMETSLAQFAGMENESENKLENKLGSKIRVHGDFHLGQVLCSEKDAAENREIWFIDFEGEPARPLSEKRRKHSPLRDVASMLRSFHYAAHIAAASAQKVFDPALPETLGELFLEAYYDLFDSSDLPPQDRVIRDALLDFFILEKAVYELHYELNNRPDWAEIPLRGLRALLSEY